MKFSTLENPAPIWNVPVGRSLTSTLTSTNSSDEPRLVETLTVLEEAERDDPALGLVEVRVWLNSSPSEIFISRRMTLSRVLALPRMLMRSK